MRLAHLHIPHLIPYTHSLRLQNALVERHFAHKDWLRTAGLRGRDAGTDYTENEKRNDGAEARSSNNGDTGLTSSTPPANRHGNSRQPPDFETGTASHKSEQTRVSGSGSASNALQNPLDLGSAFLPPDPTLLTFSTFPTYTVGRRHLVANPISDEQQAFLTADGRATFHASPRGGLLTYHAPGQLTGYIVADLRRHGITARCWVKMLEESVMRTCAAWGVATTRTDDPGVWIKDDDQRQDHTSSAQQDRPALTTTESRTSDRKICAIGVQISRGITSHGIGLNVFDAPILPVTSSPPGQQQGQQRYEFTPTQTMSRSYSPLTKGYLSWGFSRIVACGLEGKSVTWLTREVDGGFGSSDGSGFEPAPQRNQDQSRSQGWDNNTAQSRPESQPPHQIPLESVADVFAQQLRDGLNSMRASGKESVDSVYRVQAEDILSWERAEKS